MNKPTIKTEPPLNLTIAERETLIASLDKAAMDTRLAPETRVERASRVTQLRWIQAMRIQQLCAALGATCETPAVLRADRPANEHEAAIDSAWEVLISATAKKLGWDGAPTSRAMNLKAYSIVDGADRAELYRKSGLIKALEDHRPSPLGNGITPIKSESETKGEAAAQGTADPAAKSAMGFMPKDVPDDHATPELDHAWERLIAATAKKLGWEGEPTSDAMNIKALLMPKGPARTELYRSAALIKALEDQRATPLRPGMAPVLSDGETKGRRLEEFIDRSDIPFGGGTAHDARPDTTKQPETIPVKKTWQRISPLTASVTSRCEALLGTGRALERLS